MKEIPILFSTPMVQAILEGRKTMTRRTRGLEKTNQDPDKYLCAGTYHILTDSRFEAFFVDPETMDKIESKCHYGLPGDVLWVRETWCLTQPKDPETYYFGYKCGIQTYSTFEASSKFDFADPDIWKPSIHMPKEAARIWLQVEQIRVERLRDISEEDAIAEGVEKTSIKLIELDNHNSLENAYRHYPNEHGELDGIRIGYVADTAKLSFESLWTSINGRQSWDLNPWVWVVKFKILSTTGKPQICYKTNEVCKYDCKGLCRESM